MDHDNPFDAGSTHDQKVKNQGGTLAAVPMEPIAILQRCWEIVVQNPGTVAGAVLLPIIPALAFQAVQVVLDLMRQDAQDDSTVLALTIAYLVVALLSMLVQLFFSIGAIRIYSRLARGLPAEIAMLVGEGGNFLSALGAMLLLVIATMLGFLLLIVPGIILSLGLQFALYAVIDQDLDAVSALQESWRLTDGYKLTIFVVNLVIGLLGLVFVCATLGIGYFVLLPVLSLSQAVMYHSLLHLQPRTGELV